MSLLRSVAHNTFIQAAGRAVSIVLSLIIFFLVARYLNVDGYGQYTTVNAYLQFFGIVVDLGLYIYLAKRLGDPGINESEVVGDVFALRLVSAVVLLGLAPLVVLLFPFAPIVKTGVAIMSLSFFFVTMTQVLTGVFQKSFRMGRFILAEIIGRAILLLITVLAVRAGASFLTIIWTVVIGSAVMFVLTLLWARELVPFRLRFNVTAWREIVAATWPIALSISFNVIYFKADTLILSLIKSPVEVGIYGAPYRVFEALISIPAMFAGLLTPILAAAYAADRGRFTSILQRGFDTLALAAIPMVIGTQFVAGDVMKLVAKEFSASGPVLQILVFGTAAIFLGYLFSNAVVVVNKQRTMVWVYGSVALSSVLLYLFFIPRWSYFGAAGVTVAVESIVAVLAAVIVLRTAKSQLQFSTTSKVLVAGGVMAAAMWTSRDLLWYWNGFIGVVVYAVSVMALGVVKRSVLRQVFSSPTQ